MTSFGPTLLAKVLGLNDVQESSLGLVFHFADKAGLPMVNSADWAALTSTQGCRSWNPAWRVARSMSRVGWTKEMTK